MTTDGEQTFAGSTCQTVILPAVPVEVTRFIIETEEPVTVIDHGHEYTVQPF